MKGHNQQSGMKLKKLWKENDLICENFLMHDFEEYYLLVKGASESEMRIRYDPG